MSSQAKAVVAALVAVCITVLWARCSGETLETPTPSAGLESAPAAAKSGVAETGMPEPVPATQTETGADLPPEEDVPECPDYSGANDDRLQADEIAPLLDEAAAALLATNNREHQLAAALMLTSDKPEPAFELLLAAGNQGAAPGVAMWRLLILCGQRDIAECSSDTIETQAISADPGNGMMWIQLAGRRLRQGHEESAFEAMRQAVSAPRYETYFTAQIALLDRGLAAVTGLPYTQRMLYTNEFVAESPGNFEHISSRCKVDDNGVWAEICDQLGRRLMTENVDVESKKRGANLRKAVLENAGAAAALNALDAEIRQLDSFTKSFLNDESVINLLLNDEAVLRDFLMNTEMYGEQEGMRRLAAEVERLQNTPGFDQCNFVANPYIRF